jgi:hypothetical protein
MKRILTFSGFEDMYESYGFTDDMLEYDSEIFGEDDTVEDIFEFWDNIEANHINEDTKAVPGKKTPGGVHMDAEYYKLFESVSVVTINGQTYIIGIPKKGASESVDKISKRPAFAKSGLSKAFSWIKDVATAEKAKKALVFTAKAVVLAPLAVASGIIGAASSLIKNVAKGAVKVTMSALHGMGHITKWAGTKAYSAATAGFNAIYDGFVQAGAKACKAISGAMKGVKKGAIAIGGFVAALGKTAAMVTGSAMKFVLAVGVGLGLVAWKGLKSLADAASSAVKWVYGKSKEAAQYMANSIKSGLTSVVNGAKSVAASGYNHAKNVASKAWQGAKNVGSAISSGVGSTVKFAQEYYKKGNDVVNKLFGKLFESDGYEFGTIEIFS